MDKYEFNIKVEQIKKMVKKEDFATAMKIADTIDWRRVRNANLLSTISQVYEKNEEYQEAKEVLLLAFERAPIGKRFLYKLTELALKEGSIREAEDYYKEFCELAPEDTRQYILRYLILKQKNASIDQLIQALERYINTELEEKWMYELAELYAKAGRGNDCVQLCDKMILLFGIGTYVEKAAELKKRYAQPNSQQRKTVSIHNRTDYDNSVIQMPGTSVYSENWQNTGGAYGAGSQEYETGSNYGTGYSSGNNYDTGAGYGSQGSYQAEQGHGPVGGYGTGDSLQDGYGTNAGYGSQNSYGMESGYGSQGGYGTESDYGSQGSYGMESGYGSQGGYGTEPGYGSQGGYGTESGYGSQGGYGTDASYVSESGYESDKGFGTRNNYEPGGGYGSQSGYGTRVGYGGSQSYISTDGYPAGAGDGSADNYNTRNSYGGRMEYGSADNYAANAGYGIGNGYGAEQSSETGGQYGAEPGYDDEGQYGAEPNYNTGTGYGTETYYSAGTGYGTSAVSDNRYDTNTAGNIDYQGRRHLAYSGADHYRDTSSYDVQEPYEDTQAYHTGNIYGAGENYDLENRYGNNQTYGIDPDYGSYAGYEASDGYESNEEYDSSRDYEDNSSYETSNGYVRDEIYGSGSSYDSGTWAEPEREMAQQRPAGYGAREYGYSHSQNGYPAAGPYVMDEEMMANLHQAAAEKELAAEMSRISTEEYAEPEPMSNQTRVFRGKNNIRVLRPRMEEEKKTVYHRSYTPHHMIIEAEAAQEGVKIAVEELKKVHQETGVNNSVIKISGSKLSKRGVINVSDKLAGKDLIVEEAGDLNQKDLEELQMLLERDETGMIVVLIDNPLQIEQLHQQNPGFINLFKCIGSEKAQEITKEPVHAAKQEEEGAQDEPHYQAEPKLSELQPTVKTQTEPEQAAESKFETKAETEPEQESEPEIQPDQESDCIEEPESEAKPEQKTAEDIIDDKEEAPEKSEPDEKEASKPDDDSCDSDGYDEEYPDSEYSEEDYSGEDYSEEENVEEEYPENEYIDEEYPEDEYPEEHEYQDTESDEDNYDEVYDEDYEEEYNSEGYEDSEPIDEDEELGIDAFTDYAVQYASEIDCSITGKSLLALCQHVEAMEENGIPLTRANAEDMIEEAADKAEKPSIGGLIKGVFSSKYDKEGLLILKEEHFL